MFSKHFLKPLNMFRWCFLNVSRYFSIVRNLCREPHYWAKNLIFKNFSKSLKTCFVGVFWVFQGIFMPPPLGAGGIMFSSCPSVRPSVRPSEAWNTLFWPVHRSVGPPDQPLPFYGMSVRPSVRPSVCPSVRRGFRTFAGDCMEEMAWNFTCWCILTIFRTD